jgi:hypothetical protein
MSTAEDNKKDEPEKQVEEGSRKHKREDESEQDANTGPDSKRAPDEPSSAKLETQESAEKAAGNESESSSFSDEDSEGADEEDKKDTKGMLRFSFLLCRDSDVRAREALLFRRVLSLRAHCRTCCCANIRVSC